MAPTAPVIADSSIAQVASGTGLALCGLALMVLFGWALHVVTLLTAFAFLVAALGVYCANPSESLLLQILVAYRVRRQHGGCRWIWDRAPLPDLGRLAPGQPGRGRTGRHHLWIRLVALAVIVLPQSIAAAPTREVRRILILNEAGTSYPAINIINRGIQTALDKSPYQLEIYSEYLDTLLFPDPATQKEFRDFYLHKYRNRRPDVIITVGPSPLKFMLEVHRTDFPGVPVAFCLPIGLVPGTSAPDPDFTGVENDIASAETLEIALRLQPATQHVVVVGGVSDFDRRQQAAVKEQLKTFTHQIDIVYLTDFTVPELLERLRHLPNHTIVLLTSVGQDAAGTRFKSTETGTMVAAAANVPVFTLFDTFLDHGEVGGDLSSFSDQGAIAGDMALRMLRGEKPQDIPRVKDVTRYMFDWRALMRWGLDEKKLPHGSIVLNRQATVWESYKWYFIGGLGLIFIETLLVLGLLWQRERRRRSERYARELVLRSPVAMLVIRGADHRSELVNHKFTEIFGYTSEDMPDEARWGLLAYPNEEYREAVKAEWQEKAARALRQQTDIEPMEASVRCKDGSTRRIEFHFASLRETRLLTFVDITERQRAEVKLRESERRFRLVANSAPVMIWMSGTDKLCNYFNQTWLEFTGRTLERELNNGWAEGVHPDDLERCMETYVKAFERRDTFRMQYRLRRHDGVYRWVLDIGAPRFGMDGLLAGYIGSCLDITQSKLAEEALAGMGRRLIQAQEQERAWIARELHDDINQQIALLAVELEQWGERLPESQIDLRDGLREFKRRLSDLSTDIQALSHHLHSSHLEYLGIAGAANNFCEELSGRQNVEIDFICEGIPPQLPKEVGLCLFRILQETLHNAVKHSGVRHFRVELIGNSEEIQLTVTDRGVGFDYNDAMTHHGLGLISMRERLQMVNGELSISSYAGCGTTVNARVPLKPEAIPADTALCSPQII
jgi:PAS domain S-box-containing protein